MLTTYSTAEIQTMTGLKPTMLAYLARQELVVPTHTPHGKRGRRRIYSFGDLVFLTAVAAILEKGVSVKRLKESIPAAIQRCQQISPDVLPWRYIYTDGAEIYVETKDGLLEAMSNGQITCSLLLDLELILDKLRPLLRQ
ncbi:MAG: MerR family transcriptional regulator [Reyranellaceae bacterium]